MRPVLGSGFRTRRTGHAGNQDGTCWRSVAGPRVRGFRIFGQGRVFSFDALLGSTIGSRPSEHPGERRRGQALTIGRDEGCDISLAAPTVSARHATVTLDASVRDTMAPVFLLRDCESKNGIDASARGLRGPFARVRAVPLTLGLHVRIGAMVLVAVDRDGACPIVASSESDFIARAHALYGSAEEAARFIGLPARRIRERLGRTALLH
jgi:FHA domain